MSTPRATAAVLAAIALFPNCATYQAEPLVQEPTLRHGLDTAAIDPKTMPLEELVAHKFDSRDGMGSDEIAMLAVAYNPELRIARADAAVAEAQRAAAGAWPTPQLSLGYGLPLTGDLQTSATAGIGFDINALLSRGALVDAGKAEAAKANLSYLWQQWQTVQQARLLYAKISSQRRALRLLGEQEKLTSDRAERTAGALAAGHLTLDVAGVDQIALQDVRSRQHEAQRQDRAWRSELDALLGLSPEVDLPLKDPPETAPIADAAARAALKSLAVRRPDLVALAAGYQSAEAKVRQAVLAQYPSLSVGITRSKDNTGLVGTTLGIGLTLPLFDHGGGNVLAQEATRERLRTEYEARLNSAAGEVEKLLLDRALLRTQLQELAASLPRVRVLADRATAAFQGGNIDALVYAELRTSLLAKELEQNTLEESIAEQNIIIATLVGHELSGPRRGGKL